MTTLKLKIVIAISLILALGLSAYFGFFYKPCIEPTESQIMIYSLQCSANLAFLTPDEVIMKAICEAKDEKPGCALSDADAIYINKAFTKLHHDCLIELAKKDNMCFDSIESNLKKIRER